MKMHRLTLLVLIIAGIANAALLDNLELYLSMDGNVTDTSGNSAVTSINGTPSYVTGQHGQAISLTNPSPLYTTPQYVNAGSAANLNFGTSIDFTVQFWVKTTSSFPDSSSNNDDPAILSNKDWNSGNNQGWFIGAGGDGRLQWNIGSGSSRMDYDGPANQINSGNWIHVVWSVDRNGSAVTYVNNSVVDTHGATTSYNINTPAGMQTRVGTDGTAGTLWPAFFPGAIDEVAIWSRALSASEVTDLYNGAVIPEPASALMLAFACLLIGGYRRFFGRD